MEPKADLRFPTQQELLFPLLEVLAENGPMQAKDACQAVAEKINLRPELRNVSVSYDDGRHHTNLFDRKTRWVRQNATIAQLIPKTPIGIWSLSEEGHRALTMARPGVVICVSRDEFGHVLWAEALSAGEAVRVVAPGASLSRHAAAHVNVRQRPSVAGR